MNNEQDLPTAMPQPQESSIERAIEPCEAPKEWKPSHNEALREHEINIRFLNRGCIVRVGCKEIAFEDVHQAMREINEYVNYPWDVQQKWRKILD